MTIDTQRLRELAQTDWAKASGKWALLESAADDLDAFRGKVEVAEAGFNAAVSKANWQAYRRPKTLSRSASWLTPSAS